MSEATGGRVTTRLTASSPFRAHAREDSLRLGVGQLLDIGVRGWMEARFARDFGDVRIHTDTAAQSRAGQNNALAWTFGRDIGFAAGRYAPHSDEGRRLLAHELAHVVQQTLPGAQPALMCKPDPTTAPVRAATPEQTREFVEEAISFMRSQAEFFSQLPQQRDPSITLPHVRATFRNARPLLRNDTSTEARGIVARLHGAYIDAVRRILTAATRPAPGSTVSPPTLDSLYQHHRTVIEPFAMPIDSGASELSSELEAPLPENPTAQQQTRHQLLQRARQRMRVSTAAISMTYTDLFEPNATHVGSLPAGMTVRFAGTIPRYLHAGFREVVIRMGSGILEPNSTLMLALDLRRFGGGNDAYRFTRLDLASTPTPQIEVWVERQGSLAGETVGTAERVRMQQKFDRAGFRRDTSYASRSEFDQALIGVGEVPDAQLSGLGGMLFKREGAHPTSATTSAEYRIAGHEIAVFDRAYAGSLSRQGRPGRTLTGAAYIVAHEIGHAVDLAPLRRAHATRRDAEAAMLAEFRTGQNTWGYGAGTSQARRDRYDVLNTAISTARTGESSARSRSGARWQNSGGQMTPSHILPPGEQPAFRAAAARDDGPGSPRMPTNYPNVDPDHLLQEYYAESFALFQASPDLLRRIRPNVFAFFQSDLPR